MVKILKIAVIVPVYKQSINWSKIVSGLRKQSIHPDCVYLILDRPQDDTAPTDALNSQIDPNWNCIERISKINATVTEFDIKMTVIENIPDSLKRVNNTGNIFRAGTIRNMGLDIAVNDGCDIFIFIDGDCIPQTDLVKSHVDVCNTQLPVLSIGRRRESKYRWLDQREVESSMVHLGLFTRKSTVINNPELLKKCLIVWSCNMAINKNAVKLIERFNKTYYNKDELFNSVFDGKWGGEDSFLGITAWYCRVFITSIGNMKSGVEHIDHLRPESVYNLNHKQFFESQCEILRKKTTITPISLDMLDYSK